MQLNGLAYDNFSSEYSLVPLRRLDPWPGMLSIRIQVNTYVQTKQRKETPISTLPPALWPPYYKNKDAHSSLERIKNVLK